MESKSEFVLPLAFSVCFRTALTVMIGFIRCLLKVPGTDRSVAGVLNKIF